MISARLYTSTLKVNPAENQKKGWWQKCSGYIERCITVGLRISGHRAAGIFTDFTEEPKSLGITSTSAIHKSCAASCQHPRKQKRPSLGKNQVKVPHQLSPYALKFEDRSQEETERQERCARGDACKLAKNILELKKRTKLPSSNLPTNGVSQHHPW